MRFEFLPVGTGVLDGPETIRSSLRIGVSMRFEFLPVGVDVLDDPRSNFKRLQIIAGCKLKILSFPGRRGRRPLQAKIQTASTRRYGAKTLSVPGRRGRRSLQAKSSNRIDTPIRSGNLIVSGASRTSPPTGNCKHLCSAQGDT